MAILTMAVEAGQYIALPPRMRTAACVQHAPYMLTAYTLQVHIVYGTEDTSNAELLSHYGFVDRGATLLSSSTYYST